MRKKQNNRGFSLTEVLLAVGTLSVGMIFVAGVFPVAIHFSTIASERTIAAVVADEAFAKIMLYAIGDPTDPSDDIDLGALRTNDLTNFTDAFPPTVTVDPNEFAYPSTNTQKQYCWSALCRRLDASSDVQVTVFVCRKIGAGSGYWGWDALNTRLTRLAERPVPVPLNVSLGDNPDELVIKSVDPDPSIYEETFINDDYTIVDNETGRLYRVLKRYADDPATPVNEEEVILLDRPWLGSPTGLVWVVPPTGGGRCPCIAVYQKVMSF